MPGPVLIRGIKSDKFLLSGGLHSRVCVWGGVGVRVMNKIVQKISVSYDDGGYKGMWSRDWGSLGGG